jgi:protein-S-isoprenylcysteine O-methyltransferase Ste14
MNIYRSLIGALWLVLGAYWAVAAIGVKRSVGGRQRTKAIALRLGVIVLILLVVRLSPLRHVLQSVQARIPNGGVTGVVGVVLCALGVGLAIWARAHIDRNWGMPMSQKENPELVMTGPYAFVRHPIYSGILLAMLGSALAATVFWVIPFVLFGSFFVYSARREEAFMTSQFPGEYPAYMKRSHMLLPWPNRTDRSRG